MGGCRVQELVGSFPTFSLSGSCLSYVVLISKDCSAFIIAQPFP